MRLRSGIKVLEEETGSGLQAELGDTITLRCTEALSGGDIIQPAVEFEYKLGARSIIAGLEYSIYGMRTGGYRRVRISPHLAYRDHGVPGKVPSNAVLICDIWLLGVCKAAFGQHPGQDAI